MLLCAGRTTLKWRRSKVAMLTARNLSAAATTMASAVPRGKSEYCSTRSAARLASGAVTWTSSYTPSATSRRKSASAFDPARL